MKEGERSSKKVSSRVASQTKQYWDQLSGKFAKLRGVEKKSGEEPLLFYFFTVFPGSGRKEGRANSRGETSAEGGRRKRGENGQLSQQGQKKNEKETNRSSGRIQRAISVESKNGERKSTKRS